MTREDMIMMSSKELRRLHLIQQVLDKKVTQQKAAEVLGLTDRQIRRIVKRVRREGPQEICHGGRGKPSNQRISKEVKEKVILVYRRKYADFGPTLVSEKLGEGRSAKRRFGNG